MAKFKSFSLAVILLIVLFFIGFFGINIIMKFIVGHGNEVEVPNLKGVDFDVARKKLKEMNLYLQKTDFVHDEDIEKGKIISQEPHAGIITKEFRKVEVVVSEGPEMVRIPFLENLSVSAAKLKLENVGLKMGEQKYRYSDEVEADKIIYSQPFADELIPRNSTVQVIVSLGKLPQVSDKRDEYKSLLDQLNK
jgi:serine/threonine-protein kinase